MPRGIYKRKKATRAPDRRVHDAIILLRQAGESIRAKPRLARPDLLVLLALDILTEKS